MASRDGGVGREQGRRAVPRPVSLRMVLVLLALVPSLALVGLCAASTWQLAVSWRALAAQDDLSDHAVAAARGLTVQLQAERRLTAEAVDGDRAARAALSAQRRRTDTALRAFRAGTAHLPGALDGGLRDAVAADRDGLGQLTGIRKSVDDGIMTDEISFTSYTDVISGHLGFFEGLGNAAGGDLATAVQPLLDILWADEMLSREDATLSYSWAQGGFQDAPRTHVSQWAGAQKFLMDRVTAEVGEHEQILLQNLEGSTDWNIKETVEETLAGHRPASPDALPLSRTQWRQAMDRLQPRFTALVSYRSGAADTVTDQAVGDLRSRVTTYAALCVGSVAVVIAVSVLLTRLLRRRILALRDEAARLETELPAVMARLRNGESVDTEQEAREVRHGTDEMGRLGQTLNLARRAAIETTVREMEQHQGFQRLLQRIARRTQLLIGQQLKKLDTMERGQADPAILEDLFDLDHLASRLRRYEENLVVLAGGQAQRHWRRPVRVVDVLRGALGEVQDYRRIRITVPEGEPWLAGRAVGPLVHILAELMENAAAFSRPPNPVHARADLTGDTLTVTVEDRGLGLAPEEYEQVNAMMAEPPTFDVHSRAEDVRLGLYVVARLAAGLGLTVAFAPVEDGGTRVRVTVPGTFVTGPPGNDPAQVPWNGAAVGPGARRGVPSSRRTARTAQTAYGPERTGKAAQRTAVQPHSAGLASGSMTAGRTTTERRAAAPEPGGAPKHVTASGEHGGPVDTTPAVAGDERQDEESTGHAVPVHIPGGGPADEDSAAPPADPAEPVEPAVLPRRTRLASLAPGLMEPRAPRRPGGTEPQDSAQAARSHAALGAFQRASRRSRDAQAPADT